MLKQFPAKSVLQRSRISLVATIPGHHFRMSVADSSVPMPRQEDVNPKPQAQQAVVSQYFPMGYKEAAFKWWSSATPSIVERQVLSLVPYLREAATSSESLANPALTSHSDPYGNRVWRRSLVKLSGNNRALNEVSIEREGEEVEETLVMVHGYGAGLGFFYKNFEPITRTPGLKLYALDMLGMGNSSRPPFKIHAKKKEDQIIEAENWFVDALEEWRKTKKIERFTLLGHSLGGYLAVSYALKYPGHLNKLILASPVGIPKNPYAVHADLPDPQESKVQNEVLQEQEMISQAGNPDHLQNVQKASPTAPPRRLPGWLVWLWDANISPFSIIRMAGPLGPRFVSGWTARRFNHLPSDEASILHDYSFSIFKQKGSGEYALSYILAPGAYARRPAIDRIQDVGRQVIREEDGKKIKENGIPIVFMYGDGDWMDVNGGIDAEKKLNERKAEILAHGTEEEKRNENGSASVVIIKRAGHHLYIDNPDDFNEVLRKEMDQTMAALRQKKNSSS